MKAFIEETAHEIIAKARRDSEVYKKNALPLKEEKETFSCDVIGKDHNGKLGIICYDYELGCWLSHTDDFNLEEDFVWSYPTQSLMNEVVMPC